MLKFIKYWMPAIVYASSIFILSSFQHLPQPELFPNADKIIHIIEYAIFTFILVRAFGSIESQTGKNQIFYFAVIVSSIYGLSDEIHQAFVPGRECSFIDWLSDTFGALIFLFICILNRKKEEKFASTE